MTNANLKLLALTNMGGLMRDSDFSNATLRLANLRRAKAIEYYGDQFRITARGQNILARHRIDDGYDFDIE